MRGGSAGTCKTAIGGPAADGGRDAMRENERMQRRDRLRGAQDSERGRQRFCWVTEGCDSIELGLTCSGTFPRERRAKTIATAPDAQSAPALV
jgi:hypothetical protein